MARTRASAAPGAAERRRAARRDVFSNEALLERILGSGKLSAADVASAAMVRVPARLVTSYPGLTAPAHAQVCRLWSRVAGGDAVWRPVWRREARSMRSFESRIAAPAGAGFRAAVAQLRGASLLTYERSWRLVDYSVAIDVTWRGQPLFSALCPLATIDFADDGENGTLMLMNLLQADESFAPLCLRSLNKAFSCADVESRAAALSAAQSVLALRVLVCRSDGAVACLLDDAAYCHQIDKDSPAVAALSHAWSLHWASSGAHAGNCPITMFGVDDDDPAIATYLDWGVHVLGSDEDTEPFASCELVFAAPVGQEVMFTRDFLLTGLSTMKWVAPSGPAACATAARARRAAADAAALVSSSDDDDSGDEE